jgi:hypothetical protein
MWQGQVYKGCICGYIVYKLDERVDYDYASSIVYGVRTMCELILCPKFEIEEFHKLVCIKGDCNNCGISKLKFYPRDNFILRRWIPTTRCSYLGSGLIEIVYVGHSDDGGDQHAIQLQCKMTLPSKFVAYLKLKLTEFVVHNFKAKWQDANFKSL